MAQSDTDSDYVSDVSDADTLILSDDSEPEEPEIIASFPGIPTLVRRDAVILHQPVFIMVRRLKGG